MAGVSGGPTRLMGGEPQSVETPPDSLDACFFSLPGSEVASDDLLDGWMCYLCSRSIDRDQSPPHPLSPSIDLRAAHWLCNIEKGDQLPPWWVAS